MSFWKDEDVEPEYYIKWIAPELYTIAKFLGTKQPSAVYTIRRQRCDCQAGSRGYQCHHLKRLREWISANRPSPRGMTDDREVFSYVGQAGGVFAVTLRPVHS